MGTRNYTILAARREYYNRRRNNDAEGVPD